VFYAFIFCIEFCVLSAFILRNIVRICKLIFKEFSSKLQET